jgi:hypothetical protein
MKICKTDLTGTELGKKLLAKYQNKMRTEVFISKESTRPYDKPFYSVYKLDNCEFVDIIGDTKSNTIKLIRENKQYVYRGKYHIDN